MPTIADVAKLAGLSRTTVSRVINNHPYVTEEKRKLVQMAMKELGYVPNSSARSLRSQRTKTIAVLIPRIMNPFFSSLIEAMEMEATDRGYQLIVCQTHYSPQRELNYMKLLQTKQVDGVILASIQNEWDMLKPFLEYGPVVMCNEFEENVNVPVVKLNQLQGGYILTKYLLQQGHRKIAYCCGGYRSNVARYREKGFRKALSEYGISFDETLAFRNAYNIEDGRTVFREIASMSSKPSAVFSGGDEVAAGIISEAKRQGWRIPEDLAVAGFDNQEISKIIEPTITTVHQPVELIGTTAVNMLIKQIHSPVHTVDNREFPLELIERESTRGNAVIRV
ncbi:LacI family transcriptional regulator [Bacillus sp. HMF5848]|uniref:LacI family DNA-binding transcriptional regulator n=1 Tax=Bacillus sp. HMF5848 TaxID=2495421 RepID=UPI000F7A1F5F|nr:LacI family DNA-binding transcriptional regulator [Bacillus sp. HMF5848]RSK29288.1 LacI family transcriptional regulator [Bacillus sp. HMF5848]